MSGMNPLDYNSADAQSAAFDLLPNGTLVKVRLTIRPGGFSDPAQGWTGGYAKRGMGAYSELQQAEFDAEKHGYTATRHQREVGTGYFDAVAVAISAG
jgi:hypothetical protein